MVHPQVAYGRMASNMGVCAYILNKQSQVADKRWPSSLELGRGAKNSLVTNRYMCLGSGLMLWYK